MDTDSKGKPDYEADGRTDGRHAYRNTRIPDPFAACWQRYPFEITIANARVYCLAYVGGYIDAHCETHPDTQAQVASAEPDAD